MNSETRALEWIIKITVNKLSSFLYLKDKTRVAYPKFGHPALSSEFYNLAPNTNFVTAVDASNAETNSKFLIFDEKISCRAKVNVLN